MKIIFINDIASVSSTLKDTLEEQGHSIKIINIMPNNSNKSKALTIINRIKLVFLARKKIKEENPDILHINYTTSGIWFLDYPKRLFIHAHGSDVRLNKNDLIRRLINYAIFLKAEKIFYSTPDLLIYLKAHQEKIKYIPNPINTNKYQCKQSHLENIKKIKILLFCAPTYVKGIDISMAAIKILVQKNKNLIFDIFLPKEEQLLYHHKQINYISSVPQNTVCSLICNYDIIIGQFRLGSLGMSELQAMSCRKPVICNLSHNAFDEYPSILHATTSYDVVEAVECLVSYPKEKIETIKNNNREWVIKNHSHLKTCAMLLEVYKENV